MPDQYMNIQGTSTLGNAIGIGGRYFFAVAGRGGDSGAALIRNSGFMMGLIHALDGVAAAQVPSPVPQVPFKVAICASYGSFNVNGGAGGPATNTLGTTADQAGGPVGPDGSTLNRHSSRW